jgi:hypothetical protein
VTGDCLGGNSSARSPRLPGRSVPASMVDPMGHRPSVATIFQLGLLDGTLRAEVHKSVAVTILVGSPAITVLSAACVAITSSLTKRTMISARSIRIERGVSNVQASNADETEREKFAFLPARDGVMESSGHV